MEKHKRALCVVHKDKKGRGERERDPRKAPPAYSFLISEIEAFLSRRKNKFFPVEFPKGDS